MLIVRYRKRKVLTENYNGDSFNLACHCSELQSRRHRILIIILKPVLLAFQRCMKHVREIASFSKIAVLVTFALFSSGGAVPAPALFANLGD